MPHTDITSALNNLYASLAPAKGLPHILPHIGDAFTEPSPKQLRVIAIGINSYISDEDVQACHPAWFRGWACGGERRFFAAIHRETATLAHGLCALSNGTPPLKLPEGLYVTNAVKRFLPAETGRHAHDVPESWFEEGKAVWKQELLALSSARSMPQVIVVFGAKAWGPTCLVLRDLCEDATHAGFDRYEHMGVDSELFHRLNVIHTSPESGTSAILVVRLDHPAARTRQWTAEHLLRHEEFLATARVPSWP